MKNFTSFFSKTACAVVLLIFSFSTNAQIKVACIGDSITEGAGLDDKSDAYPSQLQLLLKSSYVVGNFGKSGSSLVKEGRLAYWNQSQYENALKYNPDVVIIKLGTNDSKETYWIYKSDFYNDYVDLVKSFQNLPSKPKVYICYPIPAYNNRFDIRDAVIRKEIIPFIKQVAKETNATLIDLYTPFFNKRDLLSDGVHPNATGAEFLAKEVYKALEK